MDSWTHGGTFYRAPGGGDISFVCSVCLPLPSSTVSHVASLIRAHRRKIRSRWRRLKDGWIALIVLARLRNDERLADLAGGAPCLDRAPAKDSGAQCCWTGR